jgi:hypothetical protein
MALKKGNKMKNKKRYQTISLIIFAISLIDMFFVLGSSLINGWSNNNILSSLNLIFLLISTLFLFIGFIIVSKKWLFKKSRRKRK